MNGNSGNQPVQSLDRDCCLERSTMHTIGGTLMGAETCYVAAKRMVIRKDWGIPLREYVKGKKPLWL